MEEKYSVTEVEGYCVSVARSVAENFSATLDDLYKYCTISEIKNILEENCLGYDELNNPIITLAIHGTISQNVIQRVQNVAISQLASMGYLECAWDEKINEMVFWLKEEKTD